MYSDPAQIRKHVVKISLSDKEKQLIDAYTAYTGGQKSALVRELALEQLAAVLDGDDAGYPGAMEGTLPTALRR